MTVLNRLAGSLLGPLLWVALAPLPATAEADPVGVWPLRPQPLVAHGFDPPDTPYGAGHRGVDLLGRPGQTVRSALAGTVTYAGLLAGRGVVVVAHGATRTTYEPVSATVTLGETVQAGTPIGLLGQPGSHCLPRTCLHWGWIAGEVYQDPLRLVGAGPVRLLPLWRDDPVTSRGSAAGPVDAWRVALTDTLVRLAGGPAGTPTAAGRW